MLHEKMKRSRKSLAAAFTSFCPQIAAGSTSSYPGSLSHVKVEVEVDDVRFVAVPFLYVLAWLLRFKYCSLAFHMFSDLSL